MWNIEDQRPVWAEINMDALANNIREVRRRTPKEAMVSAVVKADAYGHGSVQCAKVFLENGADRLAVAALSEAIELRKGGIDAPIMVLGYTRETQFIDALKYDIILTLYHREDVKKLSEAARYLGRKAVVHVKIDTGMHRIGMVVSQDAVEAICDISTDENLYLEGMFTHFSCADSKDKTYTQTQFEKYMWMNDQLEKKGVHIPIKHVSNSAAIIDLPGYHLDMVRAGIMLYGLYPSDEVQKEAVNLKPAMTLKAGISHVKTLEKGSKISYSANYITQGEEIIATFPLGYADGYTRILNGKGAYAGVAGQSAPIVGNICMDQCMANVTGIPGVSVGMQARLFGDGTQGEPHIDEIAKKLGTINYEVVCMVARRVPRAYVRQGQIEFIKDYLLD